MFYEGFNGKFKGGRYTGVTIDNTLKALGKFPKIETFIKILEWSAFSANLSLLELLIQYEELRIYWRKAKRKNINHEMLNFWFHNS